MKPEYSDSNVEIIKRVNGNYAEVSFLDQGMKCQIVPLTSKIAKQCAGIRLILKDLELAINTINCLKSYIETKISRNELEEQFIASDPEHVTAWALFTASVITYSKCFGQAKERQYSLQINMFKKNLSTECDIRLLDLHKKIIDLRHQWVAHGGSNTREQAKTLVVLDPRDPYSRPPGYLTYAIHQSTPSVLFITYFLKLAQIINQATIQLHSDRMKVLHQQEISNLDIQLALESSTTNLKLNVDILGIRDLI